MTEVAKGSSLLVPKRVLVPHLRFHCTTWFRTVQDGGMGYVSVVGHRPLRTGPGGLPGRGEATSGSKGLT